MIVIEPMSIDSTGNVGIGTVIVKLYVKFLSNFPVPGNDLS
jgi:hypothetical protein